MPNNFVEELRWRGMIQDIMPGMEELLAKEIITGYCGFDPTTSDSDEDCSFSIYIGVLELPVVTASVDESEICVGESIILTGGGADDYEWSLMEIEDGEAYTPESGEYTYTVIGTDDETGCKNVAEVDV